MYKKATAAFIFGKLKAMAFMDMSKKCSKLLFLVRLRHICFINFAVKLLYGVAAHIALHPDDFKASGTLARST